MSSSSSSQPQMDNLTSMEQGHSESNLSAYLKLYKAVLRGHNSRAIADLGHLGTASRITPNLETALHVAVGTGKANDLVNRLVNMIIDQDELKMKNRDGDTALSIAAMVGNVEAAKLLLEKLPGLFNIANNNGRIPLLEAARCGQKEMVLFLLRAGGTQVTDIMEPFPDKQGLNLLIIAGFHDVALKLIQEHSELAMAHFYGGDESLLSTIAGMPSAFPSGTRLNFSQRAIYYCAPSKLKTLLNEFKENVEIFSNPYMQMIINLIIKILIALRMPYAVIWEVLIRLDPPVKRIQDSRLMHPHTLKLVKCLCSNELAIGGYSRASSLFKWPLLLAAQLGVHEVVEEIVESFPHAIWFSDENNHNLFQLAVVNRQEKVFNLIYQMTQYKHIATMPKDTSGNNILHLAGMLAPPHRLNLNSCAALQMQLELKWFQEVEKFVTPAYKEDKNSEGQTPAMVFTKAHKDLVTEGEKWMKAMAKSCILVAVLVATVSFAASITVPGGNHQDTGIPIFTRNTMFITFGNSLGLSLFSSTVSVLTFLSILTSSYAEADFLFFLPNKLIIGLAALFVSIIFMMTAFGASLYIVFGDRQPWFLSSVAALASITITLHGFLQFPSLVDMIKSTYGPSIFHKQSKRTLH